MSARRRKRMCPSSDERDRILQAREMGGPSFHLPWRSFAEFFDDRVRDAHRADKPFLTYYDESRGATEPVSRVYSYARFGELVGRAATVMRERLGLRRGDRVATVLFNHDQTVLVYFAAWTLGVAVVPINVEESTEKKRYILEHSEASVVFCWQDSLDEIRSLFGGLPRLREVVAVNDEGLSMPDAGMRRHGDAAGSLDDEALIVYTSGTTGPPKGVLLTARNLLVDADGIADWHGFRPDDLPAGQRRRWLTDYDFPSIGMPIRHNEMAILDDRGHEVAEHVRGEICIRGRTVCTGYFKRPDANEAAFQWGWFRSGDEGFYVRDEKGRPFLFISGRIKELIIRGGVNISPLEIDDVLKGHPGVQFAMAVPFENRYYGEEIAAYVVLREGMTPPTEAVLLEFCRGRLPFSKRPKVILFGQDVPYTTTGKPKRLELKTRLAEPLAAYRDVQFKDTI